MKWITVDSSVIDQVRFKSEGILDVQIGSSVYSYYEVPRKVFNAFLDSDSKGSFFVNNIKGTYKFRKQ